MRVCKQMLISSSYHTYYTIARLQHLLRALGREGEETERVPDGAPREQIDEGEPRRVVGGGDEGSLLRASVTGGEVRLTVLGRQTDALDLRALVRQEDESAERQRGGVGGADRDVHVVERARGDARAALRRARLLSHAATSRNKKHTRIVSLSSSRSIHPSIARRASSFVPARPSPARAIRPALIRASRPALYVRRTPPPHPHARAHHQNASTRARTRERANAGVSHTTHEPHRSIARDRHRRHHHPLATSRDDSTSSSTTSSSTTSSSSTRAPLERGDGASGNGRAREHGLILRQTSRCADRRPGAEIRSTSRRGVDEESRSVIARRSSDRRAPSFLDESDTP